MTTEEAATWLTAIGTILTVIAAVFQDKIRSHLKKPVFDISISNTRPYSHKMSTETTDFVVTSQAESKEVHAVSCYYIRILVKNTGNDRGDLVEIFVEFIEKRTPGGSYARLDKFFPMNLLWSNIRQPYVTAISPGMAKFCDFGHIIDPAQRKHFDREFDPALPPNDRTLFSLDLEVKPSNLTHLLTPGIYRINLMVAAANSEPVRRVLELDVSGDWYDDEREMLLEGVVVKIV